MPSSFKVVLCYNVLSRWLRERRFFPERYGAAHHWCPIKYTVYDVQKRYLKEDYVAHAYFRGFLQTRKAMQRTQVPRWMQQAQQRSLTCLNLQQECSNARHKRFEIQQRNEGQQVCTWSIRELISPAVTSVSRIRKVRNALRCIGVTNINLEAIVQANQLSAHQWYFASMSQASSTYFHLSLVTAQVRRDKR